MLHELVNWVGGAIVLIWLITGWRMQTTLTPEHSKRTRIGVGIRLALSALLFMAWFILTATLPRAAEVGYVWPLFFIGLPVIGLLAASSGFGPLLLVLVILIAIWFVIRLWLSIDWPKVNKRLVWASIGLSVFTVIVGYAPFPFWAQGIIAEYNVARYIALGATIMVWLIGGFWLKRLIVPTQQ